MQMNVLFAKPEIGEVKKPQARKNRENLAATVGTLGAVGAGAVVADKVAANAKVDGSKTQRVVSTVKGLKNMSMAQKVAGFFTEEAKQDSSRIKKVAVAVTQKTMSAGKAIKAASQKVAESVKKHAPKNRKVQVGAGIAAGAVLLSHAFDKGRIKGAAEGLGSPNVLIQNAVTNLQVMGDKALDAVGLEKKEDQ